MLNYCTHALEQLGQSIGSAAFRLRNPGDAVMGGELISLLKKAVKFELPVNGAIVDHDKSSEIIDADLLHLPFPVIALEYPFDQYIGGDIAEPTVAVPRRIALCAEYSAVADTWLGSTAAKIVKQLDTNGGLLVYPFFFYQGMWFPSVWGVAIPRTSDLRGLTRFVTGKSGQPREVKVGATVVPALVEAANNQIKEWGNEKTQLRAFHDCSEEFYTLVNLLVALSCSNITLQDRPAPDKLNKKRVQSGKMPFPAYKEVVVLIADEGKVASGSGWSIEGRASCRSHLRRGHIRRLTDGRRIWIQSTIVNAGKGPGDHKTYKVGMRRN